MTDRRKMYINVTTLGEFRAKIGGRDVTPASEAGRLLLAIMTLSPERRENRGRLAAMLWEDTGEQQARARLRQALYTLRSDLGPDWDGLAASRTVVALAPGSIRSDIEALEAELAEGDVPDTIFLGDASPSSLLEALPEPGRLYASWLAIRRQALENRLRERLTALVREGDAHEKAARALLNLDPSDEFAARHLIGHHAHEGDTGRALKVYSDLWDHLDDVYGMEPSQTTQDLIAAVKIGKIAPTATAQLPPAAPVRLVIPPVAAPAAYDEAGQLAELFRAELIGRLCRFREFDVLDAALVDDVTGAYRLQLAAAWVAGRARLRLTLTRTRDGRVLWSDDRKDIAEHWSERIASVADSVAAACSLNLSRARLADIRRSGPTERTLDHWLLGQTLLDEFRPKSWDEATQAFRRAIALDPDFSGAYSSLSQVENIRHLVHPGRLPDPVGLAESRDLANRAIALDPGDSRALLCRAWASMLLGDFDRAESAFADAYDCNPNDPWTVISCALGAAFGGDQVRADALACRALEERWTHAPSVWGYHATIRFLGGDYAGCVAAAGNAGDGILNIPAWEAAAEFRQGRLDAAAAAWSRFESAARKHWAGQGAPTTARLLDWFGGSFPIRSRQARHLLRDSATGAAQAYLHCMQQ
ncbi:hypothetical protein DEA8626_03098 [Defluviimonas aquaemixtae]|uniref:Bacterial transcriptional activator domain-containing protein n=1 Tax=Albidovulum aquaemixtae TaxID=1542388 RepID=A0A2R8BKU6_9RHOB|nr:BTAD domain-containing putative transcriptional regulator [Defluviimonas aquaemixtae]SPH24050.1 hypothetical protein DEA8626_03098 [Defluviimonas aquaemixtae]